MKQLLQNCVSNSEATMRPPLPRPPKASGEVNGSKEGLVSSSGSKEGLVSSSDKPKVGKGDKTEENMKQAKENCAVCEVDEALEVAPNKVKEKDEIPSSGIEDAGQKNSTDSIEIQCEPDANPHPRPIHKLEAVKDGTIVKVIDVSERNDYSLGRCSKNHIVLEDVTSSRNHATVVFDENREAFIHDHGSTHGTYVNKQKLKPEVFVPLHVGDVIRFGQYSSYFYVFQGPTELMPEEGLSKAERMALRLLEASQRLEEKEEDDDAIRWDPTKKEEMALIRLKEQEEAMALDGITWGMQEDAPKQDNEESMEEVTWQNYKGQLTDNQQKTLDKIHKRNEKLANLKKENDAIQSKEISQGGLTQGQQTQMARNEQRIEQLLEELESLEETLNESIQESMGAQSKVRHSSKRKGYEEEEDEPSDDEFYDRTRKKPKMKKNGVMEVQKLETVDSLLLQKEQLAEEMESVLSAIKAEVNKESSNTQHPSKQEAMDSLDAYMTNVSSDLVKSSASRLEKERHKVQAEINRIERLLKIADPTGEGAKNWAENSYQRSSNMSGGKKINNKLAKTLGYQKKGMETTHLKVSDGHDILNSQSKELSDAIHKGSVEPAERSTSEKTTFSEHSAWLGVPRPPSAALAQDALNEDSGVENAEFLEYRDRRKSELQAKVVDTVGEKKISLAAIVQQKGDPDEKHEVLAGLHLDGKSSVDNDVALLLKDQNRVSAAEGEILELESHSQLKGKTSRKKKRVLGPERPSFLKHEEGDEYESWLPPEGQTGDGRTFLNEKFGY